MAQMEKEAAIPPLSGAGEAQAEAGIGASGTTPAGHVDGDNKDVLPENGPSRNDVAPQPKRSTAQIVVIMAALCVSTPDARINYTLTRR